MPVQANNQNDLKDVFGSRTIPKDVVSDIIKVYEYGSLDELDKAESHINDLICDRNKTHVTSWTVVDEIRRSIAKTKADNGIHTDGVPVRRKYE